MFRCVGMAVLPHLQFWSAAGSLTAQSAAAAKPGARVLSAGLCRCFAIVFIRVRGLIMQFWHFRSSSSTQSAH